MPLGLPLAIASTLGTAAALLAHARYRREMDLIEATAPPERTPLPPEPPGVEPPETEPLPPDIDEPARSPKERPPE